MPLTGSLSLRIATNLIQSLDLSSPVDPLNRSFDWSITDGAGASQANQVFHDRRTLAASASEDLDMAGALTNAFGQTVTFARIKAIVIINTSTTQTLTVKASAANGLTTLLGTSGNAIVRPSGFLAFGTKDATGHVVTAGSVDSINIANSSGASADYDVIVIGATS